MFTFRLDETLQATDFHLNLWTRANSAKRSPDAIRVDVHDNL